MKPLFDITAKNYLQFFNRISKILYCESVGERHLLRTIFSKVVDQDRYISRMSFGQDIFTEGNLISKYCFYEKEDEDDDVIKEYRIYIMNDIPFNNDKSKVSLSMIRSFMKGGIPKVFIFIDKTLCSEVSTLEEKYKSIKYIFKRNLLYELSNGLMDYNTKKYIDIISSTLSGLLIDYSIEDQDISEAINTILSSSEHYLINGTPEIRLNLNLSEEIFSFIDTIYSIKLEKGFDDEQG